MLAHHVTSGKQRGRRAMVVNLLDCSCIFVLRNNLASKKFMLCRGRNVTKYPRVAPHTLRTCKSKSK